MAGQRTPHSAWLSQITQTDFGRRRILSEHRNRTDPETYLSSIVSKAGEDNVIVLEEKGENLDSMEYSEKMKQWRLSSNDVHLVVGPQAVLETIARECHPCLLG